MIRGEPRLCRSWQQLSFVAACMLLLLLLLFLLACSFSSVVMLSVQQLASRKRRGWVVRRKRQTQKRELWMLSPHCCVRLASSDDWSPVPDRFWRVERVSSFFTAPLFGQRLYYTYKCKPTLNYKVSFKLNFVIFLVIVYFTVFAFFSRARRKITHQYRPV